MAASRSAEVITLHDLKAIKTPSQINFVSVLHLIGFVYLGLHQPLAMFPAWSIIYFEHIVGYTRSFDRRVQSFWWVPM